MIIGPQSHSFSAHISIFIMEGKEVKETKNCFKIDLIKGKAGVYVTDENNKLIPVLNGKAFKSEEFVLSHIELTSYPDETTAADYMRIQHKYPTYVR